MAASALALGACGSSHPETHRTATPNAGVRAFSWLVPAVPPSGWRRASTAAATLAYPPSWLPLRGDVGTVSAALGGNPFSGYANATPKQGAETLADWRHFRLRRNAEEGDHRIRAVSAAANLTFLGGKGSCVIDDYTAAHGRNRYREIACFVVGPRGSTVIVAAAQLRSWAKRRQALEQIVSHFDVRS
jgi:hypothetical protein